MEIRATCSTSSTAAFPPTWAPAATEEIEEERRLLYVAMTRAKDHLRPACVPQRFYVHQQAAHGDRHVYASRTRFIPEAVLQHFEARTWPVAVPAAAPAGARDPARQVDVAARIRALWR